MLFFATPLSFREYKAYHEPQAAEVCTFPTPPSAAVMPASLTYRKRVI
jgi:hypothetical protein